MNESGHWPFGGNAFGPRSRGSHLPPKEEAERARAAERVALRQRMRHDRLIVGGRAHTKKSGLS